MTLVNEGLKAGDLEGVVSKRFSVDQFKSKMGEDRNIMVLAFTVDGMAPAKDLERFAETGYKEVLDADATPGTLEAIRPRNKAAAASDGIATTRPQNVVVKAVPIPPASITGSAAPPDATIAENAMIMPYTVPKRPIIGLT